MNLSKISFLIATVAFISITAVISYASYMTSVNLSPVAKYPLQNALPTDILVLTPTTKIAASTKPASKVDTTTPKVDSPVPPTPTQVAAPTADNRCIIVVDGQKYNVTVFKNQHSGGDIFSCGTDMSAIFHDKHNQRYLDMMTPYKI
jgi:cytochrome b involved in lipid metabolism